MTDRSPPVIVTTDRWFIDNLIKPKLFRVGKKEFIMKVIEEGKWKIVWSAEVVCKEKACGAKLLVEEDDVKPVNDSSPARYSSLCPICGSGLELPADTIPTRVKSLVDKKKRWSSSDW